MKTVCWLLCLGLTACMGNAPNSPPDSIADLTIATPNYVVLSQKALTYQADFDLEGWAFMLAPNVEYVLPQHPTPCHNRQQLLAHWQQWRQTHHVQTMRLHGFTHLPVQSPQPLSISGRAGVHVISYCTARLELDDGQARELPLTLCYHFDEVGLIDYYALYSPTESF